MLFHPFRDEAELYPDDAEKCEQLYLKNKDKINRVKARLMPFLESVDEAQKLYQENRENDKRDIEDIMGADLDPEQEQEVEEAGDEEDEEHPDYYHIDTDQVQGDTDGEGRRKQIFKAIALPDRDIQVKQISKNKNFDLVDKGREMVTKKILYKFGLLPNGGGTDPKRVPILGTGSL